MQNVPELQRKAQHDYPTRRSTKNWLRLVTTTTCRRCSRTEILFENRGISSSQFSFANRIVRVRKRSKAEVWLKASF